MQYINDIPSGSHSLKKTKSPITKPLGKGAMYVPLTSDYNEFVRDVIKLQNKSAMFLINKTKIMYTPKKLAAKIGSTMVRKHYDYANYGKALRKEVPNITSVFTTMTQVKDDNVFIDMSKDLAALQEVSLTKSSHLVNIFEHIALNMTSDHMNKFILLDITGIKEVVNTATFPAPLFKKEKNLALLFLYGYKWMPESMKKIFTGIDVLFHSPKGLVIINNESLELFTETIEPEVRYTRELEALDEKVLQAERDGASVLDTIELNKQRDNIVSLMGEAPSTETEFRKILLGIEKIRGNFEEPAKDGTTKEAPVEELISDDPTIAEEDALAEIGAEIEDIAGIPIAPEDLRSSSVEGLKNIVEEVANARGARTRELSPKEKRFITRMGENAGIEIATHEELRNDLKNTTIPESKFDVTSLDGLDTNSFVNFNKTYMDVQQKIDLVNIAKSFAETDTPLYVQKMTMEDASDALNYQDKLTIKFKDEDGNPHTATILVPKLYKNKFMIVNGTEKTLIGQFMVKPIIKDGEEVLITTNYNKAFLRYKGGRYITPMHSIVARGLTKLKESGDIKDASILFGSSRLNLDSGLTTIELIKMGEFINIINKGKTNLHFHIETIATDLIGVKSIKDIPADIVKLPLGKYQGIRVLLDKDTDRMIVDGSHPEKELIEDMTVIEFVDHVIKKEFPKLYEKHIEPIKTIPNMVGTHIKVLHKDIPLIFFIIHTDGFSEVMSRAGINYKIYPNTSEGDKRPRIDKLNQMMVKLKDSYLVFDLDSAETTALISPMAKMDMSDIELAELEVKAVTANIIERIVSATNTALYLDNFRNNLIDPITKDVLARYNMPTDFLGVMCYANTLLSTGISEDDQDLKNVRYRSAEVITAQVYNAIADAHATYAAQKKRGSTRAKLKVDKNAILRKDLPNVKEYSFNNPLLEQMEINSVSWKGPNGINVQRAYDIDRRVFHVSHYGILSSSSPYSASVGIVKQLAIDPKFKDVRGFPVLTNMKDVKNLESKHIWSVAQQCTAGSANHAESMRDLMNHGQKGHAIGIEDADPPVVTTGYEELLPHMSTQFTNLAEEDGKVVSVKDCYVTVKYKSGKTDTFATSDPGRNAAKSKFIDNNHEIATKIKKNQTFKKGDIITYNKYFFKDVNEKITTTIGAVAYVALHSMPGTYEDSTIVSETLGDRFATRNIYDKSVNLDKDTKLVSAIRKIGDKVKAGDPVVTWNNGTIDEAVNKHLDLNDINEANLQSKKSKKAGEIVDIRVYYACDKSDLSSSLRKFVTDMETEIDRIGGGDYEKLSADAVRSIKSRMPKKVKADTKIMGSKVAKDEVLIMYFTRVVDVFSQGDKMTYHGALKGVSGSVYPDWKMPESAGGIKVDAIMSVFSPLARKTNEVYIIGWATRASLGLAKYLQIALGVKAKRSIFSRNHKDKYTKIPKMNIKQAKKFIYGFYDILDRSGTNTDIAKSKYDSMGDKKFLEEVAFGHFPLINKPYEVEPTIEDAVKAVKYVGEKPSEKISLPHLYYDEETGEALMSDKDVAIIAVPLNRLQQQISSENLAASDLERRDKTNQVVGASKAASFASNEENALIAKGYDKSIVELKTIRADHVASKEEAYTQAANTGIMNIPDSVNDPKNKVTLNYIHYLWLSGLGISVDFVEDLDKL